MFRHIAIILGCNVFVGGKTCSIIIYYSDLGCHLLSIGQYLFYEVVNVALEKYDTIFQCIVYRILLSASTGDCVLILTASAFGKYLS